MEPSEVVSAKYEKAVEITPMVGVRVDSILDSFPDVPGGTYSLVRIRGTLPAGLKIALVKDASGNHNVVLSGTPTSANKNPLLVVYEVRLRLGGATTVLDTIEINFDPVAPFPDVAARATYNGWIRVPSGPETGLGTVTMTLRQGRHLRQNHPQRHQPLLQSPRLFRQVREPPLRAGRHQVRLQGLEHPRL
jgi:hypothetical protein